MIRKYVTEFDEDYPNFGLTYSFFDGLTTVTIHDYSTGIYARAHAKLNPEDEYDENLGLEIARARATARYAKKVEKLLIRQTNQLVEVGSW